MKKYIYILTLVWIMIDQLIKHIVVTCFDVNESLMIIPSFFSLSYVQNTGAAWSILSGNRIFLIITTILALFFIYFAFLKQNHYTKFEIFSYSFLLGGIFGNFIDRILYGYVIDYLDFILLGYQYPIFNFADCCIVISVFLIFLTTIRGILHERTSSTNCQ